MKIPTLNEAEVGALREAVPRSVARMRFTKPARWFTLRGVPCDGLRVPLEEYQQRPGSIIGWCTVTRTGPVSALYDVVVSGGGTSLPFRGLDCGVT